MSTINWAKLYAEGRCKDIGIPWNEEEQKAVYQLNIPVAYVRDGIVTLEDYAKALEKEAKDGKSLSKKSLEELFAMANELDLKFTPDATDKALIGLIEKALERKNKAAEQALLADKVYRQEEEERVAAGARFKQMVETGQVEPTPISEPKPSKAKKDKK